MSISVRLVLSSSCGCQADKLVKLMRNGGKRKAQIADVTKCVITIPAMDQWDEVNGTTVTIEGRRALLAAELIADELQ